MESEHASKMVIDSSRGGWQRIEYLDALKGFLILCVVFGHVIGTYSDSGLISANNTLNKVYTTICTFHMPLFMMVSGYIYYSVYYYKDRKIDRGRMTRHILDLMGVYLIFSLLTGVLKILTGLVAKDALMHEITLTDVLLIPIKPLSGFWYLYTLIILYVIFSAIQKKAINEWALLLAFFIISSFSYYTAVDYFTISAVMKHLFFFYVGLSYKKREKPIFENRLFASFLFLISIVALIVSDFSIPQVFGVITLISLCMSVGIWLIFENVSVLSVSLLQFMGKISLEIYVLHNITLAISRFFLRKVGIEQPWACVPLNFVITVVICVFITILLKELKLHELFFKPFTFVQNFRKKHFLQE